MIVDFFDGMICSTHLLPFADEFRTAHFEIIVISVFVVAAKLFLNVLIVEER
jgi:hypothetical protein